MYSECVKSSCLEHALWQLGWDNARVSILVMRTQRNKINMELMSRACYDVIEMDGRLLETGARGPAAALATNMGHNVCPLQSAKNPPLAPSIHVVL
jgi:hypothetical protein